jgi:two-component system response regulator DctR
VYKVLLVEDDPMVNSINKKFVERIPGFSVVGSAVSGSEALRLIKELEPDLLLLDIYLPQQNGLEVLRQIRHSGKEIDVILLTAAQDTETITEGLRLGVLDYLIKPYDFQRFKQALDSFLSRQETLVSKSKLSQTDLDRLQANIRTPATPGEKLLPKGLDSITLKKVITVLKDSGKPLSASALGKELNLSRTTVRRYLDYLVEQGDVTVNLQYGNMGRPTKIYAIIK